MDKSKIPDRYKILASKWKQGTITPDEANEFAAWYNNDQDKEILIPGDFARDLDDLENKIFGSISKHTYPERKLSLWPRIAVAVAMAVVVFGAGLFYFAKDTKYTDGGRLALANDIAPGGSGATLTLASGKKIRLSDAANGEIAKEAGISVTKTADGQLVYEIKENIGDPNRTNILSTAKGETYILTLPDKSKVWLNAASSLTYAANLVKNGQRRVKLTGEAYLEVTKDKSHPFIVESRGQEVEVLGTHFNINSYENEPSVATTLIEGSVKVTNGTFEKILMPGQQAVNNQKSISVIEANVNNVTDWKNGDFYFERVDFRSVMRKIGRWYDVEIVFDPSVQETITSNGLISRNNKLSTVLKSIEKSGQVHFKIEGKKVYVTK